MFRRSRRIRKIQERLCLGGVEGLERQIQEELDQKVEEEERRVR